MGRIKTVKADITSGFTVSGGLNMALDSDADLQVLNSLKKEMEAQLAGIKANLKNELTKRINEASGGALSQFGTLDDIKSKLTGSIGQANSYEKQLSQKRAEAEKQLKGKATDEAKKQLGNQLKGLF